MIAEVENISSLVPEVSAALRSRVKTNGDRYIDELRHWFFEMPPMDKPSDWVERDVTLDTPFARKQPFNFEGREYLREVIDDIDDPEVQVQTKCWGTGSSKTNSDLAMMLWAFKFDPFPGIYIMPTEKGSAGAVNFCNSCVIPTIRATECFSEMLPSRAQRHNFTGHKVEFAGNHLDFVGANSAAQIKHKRCRIMWLGEQDSYKETLGRESGTDYLAGERTKGMTNKKIIRGSTPTLEGVGIWPHLMGNSDTTGSDCRRRFLKCPNCKSPKRFVLVQSDQFTVLPRKLPDGSEINFALMRWDKEAAREDGSWDIDRVIRSTRFECPFCGFHLRDEHRVWLDRNAAWLPTRRGEYRHRGYHLPSFYAPLLHDKDGQVDFDSTWGGMAQKFLRAIDSPAGLAGYINSDLAEVNVNQEKTSRQVLEISTDRPESQSQTWCPILSVDNQQNWPYRWFVVRNFLAKVIRSRRTPEQQEQFVKELSSEEKNLVEKVAGSLVADKNDTNLLSPHRIFADIQRTDHWPLVAQWLIGNGLTEKRLAEFYQVEFQTDLIRMLEFICRQKEVDLKLGRQGDSEALEIGFCDTWEDVDEIQKRNNVRNNDVIVDARWGEQGYHQEVYVECFMRCPPHGFYWWHPILKKALRSEVPGTRRVAALGWTPSEGYPRGKRWRNKLGVGMPYAVDKDDPYKGMMGAGQSLIEVFRFDAEWALSELARLRKRCQFTVSKQCRWTPPEGDPRGGVMKSEEYLRHMKGYYWDDRKQCWDAPAKHGGDKARRYPNHLYDCEKNAVAYAAQKGIFKYERQPTNGQNP